jgi:Fe-S oxidoreductase
MKALLVDIDGIIPNLALMKISTMVKKAGGTASFHESDPTHVFISCIFEKNRNKATSSKRMIKLQYPDAVIDIGGTGYDLTKSMPEIETLYPDYDLYPSMSYSMGFTTRGCIRNCSFCVVPKKEGKFKVVQHPENFYNPKLNDMVLLDNNILANKNWFFEVTEWILKKDLRLDFNQGLDIRLVDADVAKRLHDLKPLSCWKFAFDNMDYKEEVIEGITILQDAKVNSRRNIMFYVYLDSDNEFEDALERCNVLRDPFPDKIPKRPGVSAFLMINQNAKRTQRMTDLKCWCRPWCYWTVPFSEYDRVVAR